MLLKISIQAALVPGVLQNFRSLSIHINEVPIEPKLLQPALAAAQVSGPGWQTRAGDQIFLGLDLLKEPET